MKTDKNKPKEVTSLPLAACSLHSSEQVCIELRCELGDAVENVLLPATSSLQHDQFGGGPVMV